MKWNTTLCLLAWVIACSTAVGQVNVSPLKPADRSSPRATLKTFMESMDAVGTFMDREFRVAPSRAGFRRLLELAETPVHCLDLSHVPQASRRKAGNAAALALYETLSRIKLPPAEQVPDSGEVNRWVIPDTEITIVRMADGPHAGEFLFSMDTAERAEVFFARVRSLPYVWTVPLPHIYEKTVLGGGWMVPYRWVEAMPSWLRATVWGEGVWKWLALVVLIVVFVSLLNLVHRLSRLVGDDRPLLQALVRLSLPAFLLVAVPVFAYVALYQINLRGTAGGAMQLAMTATQYLVGAWLSWRVAAVLAETIISSPHIAPQSIDAHLIRICTRLVGLIAATWLLVAGADRLGIPVYGIIAGLGVGGLAIALAAQPTLENLIGGLILFADKPIRVGNVCKYGDDMGTVEQIGIRSTRIRGLDRTLTAIPNAVLSKMPLINYTERERMLIRVVVGVRYETSPEQLRFILAKIREMLLAHPKIYHDPARARFVGFGASSLDIEVFAYVMTQEGAEFFAVQEDVFLRIMDIVEQGGSSFAFPSQTLYFARDGGTDRLKSEAAEAQVRQWRDEGRLPFPNFSPEQMRQIRRSLAYPPPGSPEAAS